MSESQHQPADTASGLADGFTARQIARALGVSVRAAHFRLEAFPPTSKVKVRGQNADTWNFQALPVSVREELLAIARERGCADVAQLVAKAPEQWTPAKPWHEIPQSFRETALKLRDALAPALARQHEISGPDLVELARVGYRQQFGHIIEDDKLRYVMDRATKRDNGFKQWQRPELYLDDAAFHQAEAPALDLRGLHAELDVVIAALEDKVKPTLDDRAHLFDAAFTHFAALAERFPAKGDQRAVKQSLVKYLYHNLPGLYRPRAACQNGSADKPLQAIRREFNLRYAWWDTHGKTVDCLRDERAGNCGRKGHCCPACEKKIHDLAAHIRGRRGKHGNVSVAYRLLRRKHQLCEKCVNHWSFKPRKNKSYVAATLRRRVTPNRLTIAGLKGEKTLRLAAPYIPRDWSDINPGDWFSADDETPNEYVWDEIEVDGEKRYIWGLVQNLLMHDLRTGYPLDFLMYFGPPTARQIRKLCHMVFVPRVGEDGQARGIGLPRFGCYFEKSAFAASMIRGKNEGRDWNHFRETVAGLGTRIHFRGPTEDEERELGLRDRGPALAIIHAISPRSKPIERDFRTLQTRLSMMPGYKGFNEREESSQSLQDFKRRVSIGKEHPGNEWLHIKDFAANYRVALQEYMHDEQNGKRLRGATPAEMWNDYISSHPLEALPREMEYTLATHKKVITRVSEGGIIMPLNSYDSIVFANEELGRRVNKPALAFWNIDFPELLTVCDRNRANPIMIEGKILKSMTASQDDLAKAKSDRRAFVRAARTIAGELSHPLSFTIVRDSQHSEKDKRLGEFIEAETVKRQAEKAESKAELGRLRRLAGTLGVEIPGKPRNLARIQESLDEEREAREAIAAMNRTNQEEPLK